MATGLLARKIGMTQIFSAEGDCIPVTVLECGPCTVVRRKTADKDGYDAVVLGFGPTDAKHAYRLSKAEVGVFQKAGTGIFRHLKEVRVRDPKLLGDLKPGDVLTVDKVFKPDQRVDVSGVTKGRGFAGVVKRHGFTGGKETHGCTTHKQPGSIGASAYPSRVIKNKRLPGRMGGVNFTAKNLRVVDVDVEQNLVLVRGAVPGPVNGLVFVRKRS
jgi:large subunit ribosomal protein L3